MAFTLSARSVSNLRGVHPKMVAVVTRALAICKIIGGPDFTVIEGVRTSTRQRELYAQGRTKPGQKVTWTLKSNHFVNPQTSFGHAVDLFPGSWEDPKAFTLMAKAMFMAADELDVPIRWGKDWDRDGVFGERGETDSPHFELWGF